MDGAGSTTPRGNNDKKHVHAEPKNMSVQNHTKIRNIERIKKTKSMVGGALESRPSMAGGVIPGSGVSLV